MRNWNVGYLGAAALIAVVGCSTSTKKVDRADQKQIYQEYRMSYDTGANSTSAVAQFREAGQSGETLELIAPASIGHDSLTIAKKNELGTKYAADKAGFVKNHKWTFTDATGKAYVNSYVILEAKVPNNLPARVAADKAFSLAWEGEAVADNDDEVTLLIAETGAVGAVKSAERISVRKAGLKQIDIPVDRVQKLQGRREVKFERKHTLKLQQGTDAGGTATTTFVSAPVQIEFFVDKAKPVDPKKADEPKKKDDGTAPETKKKTEPKKD